ncbi:hypothetical protein JXM67_05875 [candidate division WOR-3 bacterium]|nr:hypothetical protein [candidate division WOR-3 bacterium]
MSDTISIEPFEVRYDEVSDILNVDIMYLDSAVEVHAMWAKKKLTIEDKSHRRILVNLSKNRQISMSGSARKAFREYEEYLVTLDRTAFVIANSVVRMLVKATLAGLNRKEEGVLIFKTHKEALDWLKEGER